MIKSDTNQDSVQGTGFLSSTKKFFFPFLASKQLIILILRINEESLEEYLETRVTQSPHFGWGRVNFLSLFLRYRSFLGCFFGTACYGYLMLPGPLLKHYCYC